MFILVPRDLASRYTQDYWACGAFRLPSPPSLGPILPEKLCDRPSSLSASYYRPLPPSRKAIEAPWPERFLTLTVNRPLRRPYN